jgi:hypothetical protein
MIILRTTVVSRLALLLAACAALAASAADVAVSDYHQCGGTVGSCHGNCFDAPWPNHFCTSAESDCIRYNEEHWQCEPRKEPSAGEFTLKEWSQCGGRGGECNKYAACEDSAFSGYTCAGSKECVRLVGPAALLPLRHGKHDCVIMLPRTMLTRNHIICLSCVHVQVCGR